MITELGDYIAIWVDKDINRLLLSIVTILSDVIKRKACDWFIWGFLGDVEIMSRDSHRVYIPTQRSCGVRCQLVPSGDYILKTGEQLRDKFRVGGWIALKDKRATYILDQLFKANH